MNRILAAAILTLPLVFGCSGNSEDADGGWVCSASAESDAGADQVFSWHDMNKRVALANALSSCKVHSTVAGMCAAGPSDCTPY